MILYIFYFLSLLSLFFFTIFLLIFIFFFFFFSSRRRHTRSKRDWSSDVCSSDLASGRPRPANRSAFSPTPPPRSLMPVSGSCSPPTAGTSCACPPRRSAPSCGSTRPPDRSACARSEERRVGKEGRAGEGRGQQKE